MFNVIIISVDNFVCVLLYDIVNQKCFYIQLVKHCLLVAA